MRHLINKKCCKKLSDVSFRDFPSFWKGKMKTEIEKFLKNNFVIFGNIFYFFKVKKVMEIFFLYKCKYYISSGNVINESSRLMLIKVKEN